MPIQFRCPGCQAVLNLSVGRPGTVVTCPRCATKTGIPEVVTLVGSPTTGKQPPPLNQAQIGNADRTPPTLAHSIRPAMVDRMPERTSIFRATGSKSSILIIALLVLSISVNIVGAIFFYRLSTRDKTIARGRNEESQAAGPEEPLQKAGEALVPRVPEPKTPPKAVVNNPPRVAVVPKKPPQEGADKRGARDGEIEQAIAEMKRRVQDADGKPRARDKKGDVRAVDLRREIPIKVEPFQLTVASGKGFSVTCISEQPIVIDKVRYNDNYEAELVNIVNVNMYLDRERSFPVRLEIGESLEVAWRFFLVGRDSPNSYQRDIIYIDIVTNRGVFSFAPDGRARESSR
jgi:hypothetical protein